MKRVLILVVVVAAVVALASLFVPTKAAVVNGTTISQSSLNADLAAIGGSPSFQCYLDENAAVSSAPSVAPAHGVGGSSTFNIALANAWLSQLVEQTLIGQVAASKGLTVTPANLAVGRFTLTQQINEVQTEAAQINPEGCGGSATAILATLPASFVSAQVEAQATEDVLLAHNAGYGLSAAEVRRYYDEHRSDFVTICVNEAVTTTSAAATAIVTAVKAGTPFPTAAATGQTASGCVSPNDSAYSNISQAVSGLSPGELSSVLTVQEATSTQQGEYVVFQLTSRTPATFAASVSAVRDKLLSAGATRSDAQLEVAVRTASVDVNAQYGRWRPSSAGLILLPRVPPARVVLNPKANQPGSSSVAAAASG
jgi:hypothetical protein